MSGMVNPRIHEQCWDATAGLDRVRKCIRNGHDVLVLMRGVAGSGKSYLARELVSRTNGAVFSTDNYFMKDGVYQFDPLKLDEYHQKNLKEAKDAMQIGVKPIIIDNTNIFVNHMKPYIKLAIKNSYEIYFVEPETKWKNNAGECARRTVHFVPREKIESMIDYFEKINLSDVIKPTHLKINPPLIGISDDDDGVDNDIHDGNWTSTFEHSSTQGSSSWFCSALKHEKDPQKALNEEAASTSLPSNCFQIDDVQEELDLLKIFSPSSSPERSIVSNGSKQLFSLLPTLELSRRRVRTVGCQVSDFIRLFELCDPSSVMIDEFLLDTTDHDILWNDKKKTKGKRVQAGDGIIPSELDVLLALFPEENPLDLSRILEITGLENAVTLLKEMNTYMDIFTPIGNRYANVDLSSKYYDWNKADFEETTDSCTLFPQATVETVESTILAPCSTKQYCNAESVPNGYYRMELSVDMMKQLTELFGNDMGITRTYVDLPLWQCRQIYQYWQGLPVTESKEISSICDDFDANFPSTVLDEEIARILQNEELAINNLERGRCFGEVTEVSESAEMDSITNPVVDLTAQFEDFNIFKMCSLREDGRCMTVAERLKLSILMDEFPGVDRERIMECFRDNNFSGEATRKTLQLFVHDVESTSGESASVTSVLSRAKNYSAPPTANSSRCYNYDGLPVVKQKLKTAHQEVTLLWEEVIKYRKLKDKMLKRAFSQQDPSARLFQLSEARRYDKMAKDCLAQVNEKLMKANTSKSFIDLHYMDVPSAIGLLRAKLKAADRPPELRHGHSGRKISVLTGYGKSSNGQAKIKTAVIRWLEQCGYKYSCSVNKGEVVVECK